MASSDELARQRFDESVPKMLQRDVLRTVLACYQQADRSVRRRYPWQEAQVMRGHTRRADLEVDLRNVAAKYVGAEADPVPNVTRSAYHSVLRVGEVRIIQSKLRNRSAVPKKSIFRSEYADDSDQYLLEFMKPRNRKVIAIQKDSNSDHNLTAVLAHGCCKGDKARPSFVFFGFINKDCDAWIGQIDLFKRFPDVLAEFYAPIAAAENEQRRVRLKKGIKRGGKERQA